MNNLFFLFFVIFLEGYIVLSAELLAIRQTVPYVGSGTDTVSIIIAAVLMPLAVGYYAGGQFYRKNVQGKYTTVRNQLLKNIFISSLFLIFGLSYVTVAFFFSILANLGIENRLLSTTIYSVIFLVTPVFLLAQTIPLVSNFFNKEKLSMITGKMLFFSTLGSFMGAVFSTLVIMSFLGAHHTTTVIIGCLTTLYLMLSKKRLAERSVVMVALLVVALVINSDGIMRYLNIVENNQYNVIRVTEMNYGHTRMLSLNHNQSSLYTDPELLNGQFGEKVQGTFAYVDYINRNVIKYIKEGEKVYSILIIGAGGFTIGIDDDKNEYVYVDIDKSLKRVSEEHFLKQKLGENKKFEPVPARSYLYDAIREGKKFDLIVVDAYLGARTIPEHLVTQEFYYDIRKSLTEEGIMVANFISSSNFSTAFSLKIDNTLRRVFPHLTRQIMEDYNVWDKSNPLNANILYIFHNRKNDLDGYYSDNINRLHYDKNRKAN